MNFVGASGRRARWRLHLAEYDFDVTYVKGTKNGPADALRRTTSTGGTTVHIDAVLLCYSVLNTE